MRTPLLYVENHTSWRRVWMLFKLYGKPIKRALVIYGVAIILIYAAIVLMSLIKQELVGEKLMLAIGIMFTCSPLLLAYRDYRPICQQLPVNKTEKMGFLLLTFFILFPAMLIVLGNACEWIAQTILDKDGISFIPSFANVPEEMSKGKLAIIGLIQLFTLLSLCLYYVVTTKGNRSVIGMLSVFVGYIAFACISGLTMLCIGFYVGFTSVMSDAEYNPDSITTDSWVQTCAENASLILSMLFLFVGIAYILRLYKYLRNNGF